MASFEELVAEVHVIFLLGKFVDLAKLVHVELPDERRQVFVSEEEREDLVFKLFAVLYLDFLISIPAHVLSVLFALN